ncbi:Uncharacterised protein [Candidatus Venteria ishoeyi]|uniref:Uncharacterized protein n=1 Tax=Candidatus Venteria ishoeyi TaxID=1899563 RepID=A0A1H6F5Y1_9GAMM|nr:Uncharacterised protein [Candidatus Venteria ishoeyi]
MPGAVRQVTFFLAALTGALNESNAADFFTIGRAFNRAAVGFFNQGFQTHLVNHIGIVRVEFAQLAHVVRFETTGLDDSAKVFRNGGTAFRADVCRKTTGCAAGAGHSRVQMDSNLVIGCNFCRHCRNAVIRQIGKGRGRCNALA